MTDFLTPDFVPSSLPGIRSGIERHYRIDRFMDSHPLVARSRAHFFPFYRHYAAVLVDVFYDHLLALNWAQFSDCPLQDFSLWVYEELSARRELMPPRMKNVVPSMISDNWLVSYSKPEGVRYALSRVQQRSSNAPDANDCWEKFAEHKEECEAEFLEFFPLIVEICV